MSHKDDGKKVRCEIHNPAIDQDGNYKVNWTREFTLKVLVKFLYGNEIVLLKVEKNDRVPAGIKFKKMKKGQKMVKPGESLTLY